MPTRGGPSHKPPTDHRIVRSGGSLSPTQEAAHRHSWLQCLVQRTRRGGEPDHSKGPHLPPLIPHLSTATISRQGSPPQPARAPPLVLSAVQSRARVGRHNRPAGRATAIPDCAVRQVTRPANLAIAGAPTSLHTAISSTTRVPPLSGTRPDSA
ncbi:hypothetical protein NDU88_008831 [Pleurodeles waltl]|uniref:Uncharacterized protein n=1 Tax=Pleurodeles waltl TaxID=8319 RepID=A0AAV7QSX1_PLEWA|nr:hypothetical protein NDU88_008831 [Pleurodeles waltl]